MRKCLGILGLMAVLSVGPSHALVVTFDDLGSNYSAQVGSYDGFLWNNFYAQTYTDYNNYWGFNTNNLASASGNTHVYNGFGVSASAQDSPSFLFNGAYLTGWKYVNDQTSSFTANSVKIDGYLGGDLVGSYTASLGSGMQYFASGWTSQVDNVVFTPDSQGKWFLMDNFTYNEQPVPEPATAVLLGAGLGLAAWRKARKRLQKA